jgi:hypothetical protein
MRGYPFIPGSSLMAVNTPRVCCRQQKPRTSVDVVSRRVGAGGIEFGEPALCARQALLGSRQQPLDRLCPVAFDGIPIVVQTAVIKDAEIELRGRLTAFGSKPEVLIVLVSIAPSRSAIETLLAPRCASDDDRRPAGSGSMKAFAPTMIRRRDFIWGLNYYVQWELSL